MSGLADYEPRTPQELARDVDEVVEARLAEIVPGYSDVVDGDEIPYLFARFEVVNRYSDADSALVHEGSVYVRLDQGPIEVETGRPSFDLARFEEALPRGTEAVLFLNDITEQVKREIDAIPAGAHVAGAPMDGVLLNVCGRLVGGKDDLSEPWSRYETLADVKAALKG